MSIAIRDGPQRLRSKWNHATIAGSSGGTRQPERDHASHWNRELGAAFGQAVPLPFHDDTPTPAGEAVQPREYMAMGVIDDAEIGHLSNLASAVFQA